MSQTSILTILPFSIEPRFSEVATGWIDDPQFWDTTVFGTHLNARSDDLAEELAKVAAGREIVVALGGQNRVKGFDLLSQIWCGSEAIRERFLFCAAGSFAPESAATRTQFSDCGGLVIDRRISNEELFGLYNQANIVWSCYAADYDQASGIFGRAVQFGLPSVLRSGSQLEKMAKSLDHEHLALSFNCPESDSVKLLAWQPNKRTNVTPTAHAKVARERSTDVLLQALYGVTKA